MNPGCCPKQRNSCPLFPSPEATTYPTFEKGKQPLAGEAFSNWSIVANMVLCFDRPGHYRREKCEGNARLPQARRGTWEPHPDGVPAVARPGAYMVDLRWKSWIVTPFRTVKLNPEVSNDR